MTFSWNEVFNPTKEQRKRFEKNINRILQEDILINGSYCGNCKHSVYVQESVYSDYTTCKFDKNKRVYQNEIYCCNKYEFVGFREIVE